MKKILIPLLILCISLLAFGCQKAPSSAPTTQPEHVTNESVSQGATVDVIPDATIDNEATTDEVVTDPTDTTKDYLGNSEATVTEPDQTDPLSENVTTIPGTATTPTEPAQTEPATAPNTTTSPIITEPPLTIPPSTDPPATEPITVTYQQYLFEMTGEQQQEFINSFGSYESFFAWLNQAKAEYEDQRIPIDGTTPIKP